MTKSYCSVAGCSNRSDKLGLVRFFKLPADADRCTKWLENIGRTDLRQRKGFRPNSYCVCSVHFEDSCIIRKQYVTSDAVPTLLLPGSSSEHEKEKCLVKEEPLSPSVEIKAKPVNAIKNNFNKLAEWQNKIRALNHVGRKQFAINLYFASPNLHKLLKSLFKLPNVSALHKPHVKIPLKHDERVVEYLALKMKSLPAQAKYCTMCLGEVELRPHLYYDIKGDSLIGFHYINSQVSNKIATRAYVIMLQGIFHKWQLPLSYAFLPDLNRLDDLGSWVDETITALHKIGVDVKAIITDQDSNFDKFAKYVKGVTIEQPYFYVEKHKVYYIFDVPKLLCGIRDALVDTDFVYEGEIISWKFINMLYENESAMGLRLAPKLTLAHVNPKMYQFVRPQVELAAQVFSRTVSVGLDTHVTFKTIAKEANATSRFVESMDNLFDILNSSKVKSHKPLRMAFKDTEEQRYVLTEAFEMFSNLRVVPKDQLDVAPIYETFQNFQITIQSVWQLYQEFSELSFEQLFTRRLNKNNLNVFFGSFASQPTSSPPTAVKFSRAFSKFFMSSMLEKTSQKNVDLLPNACSILFQAYSATERGVTSSSLLLNPKQDYHIDLPEDNLLSSISSYLFYKSYKPHACLCLTQVIRKHLYMENPLNSGASSSNKLKLPPQAFVEYVARLEAGFVANCECLTRERPGNTILEALSDLPAPSLRLCPCFSLDYCIKLFVRLRIFTTLKYNQKKIREGVMTISVPHLCTVVTVSDED